MLRDVLGDWGQYTDVQERGGVVVSVFEVVKRSIFGHEPRFYNRNDRLYAIERGVWVGGILSLDVVD